VRVGHSFSREIRVVWSQEFECKPSLEREQRQGSYRIRHMRTNSNLEQGIQVRGVVDVIPKRLIAWAMSRPKSCLRPNPWPSCTFKPKPIKKPNNKGHAKKDQIGLHSRWPKPTWASHTLHMG